MCRLSDGDLQESSFAEPRTLSFLILTAAHLFQQKSGGKVAVKTLCRIEMPLRLKQITFAIQNCALECDWNAHLDAYLVSKAWATVIPVMAEQERIKMTTDSKKK